MKKTMKKTILSILSICIFCILLCLYGCSSHNSKNNDPSNISTQDAQSETNESSVSNDNETITEVTETIPSAEELMKSAVLQYPSQNGEWKYNVYDCYVEITGYIGENVETLIIPNEIESLPVWSYNPELVLSKIGEITLKDTVKSIILPSELLVIGEGAFSTFKNIENITLPNSIIEIKENAFYGCQSLCKVSIPETLRILGDEAFYGCSSLKQIILPSSVAEIGDLAFDYTNNNDGVELTVYNSEMSFSSYSIGKLSIIRGYAGSTAAQYAAKHHINFEVLK